MFKRRGRGLKLLGDVSAIVFRDLFLRFSRTLFRIELIYLGGNFVLQVCRPNKIDPQTKKIHEDKATV